MKRERWIWPWKRERISIVERPGDVGMDIPAGRSAKDLTPASYRPVDMEHPEERRAAEHSAELTPHAGP